MKSVSVPMTSHATLVTQK